MKSDWVIEPSHYLRYLRKVRGLRASEIRIPARVLLLFGSHDFALAKRVLRAKPTKGRPWIAIARAGRRRVSVTKATIGAPAAVVMLEELIASGAKEVVFFGACGSLVPGLGIGSVILPTWAYSEEGTSRHYGGGKRARPDGRLTAALGKACMARELPCREGGVWTTDAPYRESRSRARALARQGVLAVEMEASALFNVARYRGVRAAGLFVVSDELGGDDWNAGFDDARYHRGTQNALDAVVDVLGRRGS